MLANLPKKLWAGKIPASFELALHEVQTHESPDCYYVMLPRSGYLTLFTQSILDHFQDHVGDKDISDVWFEYKEKTLRWHYPCGVLYDLFCADAGSDLPWCITVHFHNFPETELIRCPSLDAVESHFMTVLKEADQLKHRGLIISDMSKNQHKQLWHGLKMDNFDEFWQINKKFMDGFEGTLSFKNIPLKVYCNGKVIQKLIRAISDEETKDLTLYDALSTCLPTMLANGSFKEESTRVILHGITPPLNTSLQWLSENMAYADNFLHVCICST